MRVKTSLLKVLILSFLALCVGKISAGAASSEPVLAQYHFSGVSAVAGDPNFARLNKIWSLPQSAEFEAVLLQRAAKESATALSPKNASGQINSAVLLRPLLDDLVDAESAAVVVGPSEAKSFALAIKLDKARITVWENSLARLLDGWNFSQPKKAELEKFDGQAWKKDKNATLQLFQAGDWLVIGSGEKSLSLEENYLQSIRKTGRPVPALQTNFLEASIDWPHLKTWWPMDSLPLKPARTDIELSCKADRMRTVVRATYPENIRWKSQPWKVPTNTIRYPLSSFTAAQDLSPFVKVPKEMSTLPVNPLTNQFFIWAQSDMPFQTFSLMRTKNAGVMLTNLATVLPKQFNAMLKEKKCGELLWVPQRGEIIWQGLTILVPTLSAIKENAGEFLLASAFPLARRKEPLPKELIEQFSGKANLVFYDWEYTGGRLDQWRILGDMLPVLPNVPVMTNDMAVIAAGKKGSVPSHRPFVVTEGWLSAVIPLLENTATEINQTGPNEITVVRKSNLGLTAFELTALTHQIGGSAQGATKPRMVTPAGQTVSPGAADNVQKKP